MTLLNLSQRAWSILRDEGVVPMLVAGRDYLTRWLRNRFDCLNIRLRYIKNRLRYGSAVASPYSLISVDPDDIMYDQLDCAQTDWNNQKKKWEKVATKHGQEVADSVAEWYRPDAGRFQRQKNLGKILSGDWDKHTQPWKQRRVYRSIKQVYDEGVNWRETPLFKKRIALYELTGDAYGYDVEDPIGKRISYIEGLHDSIVENGFLTQEEAPDDHRNRNLLHNITINIGRNGELIFNHAGQHRLAFAKYLNIDQIPVLVIVRHKKWQQLRKRMSNAESKGNLDAELLHYYDHPDMVDVKPK